MSHFCFFVLLMMFSWVSYSKGNGRKVFPKRNFEVKEFFLPKDINLITPKTLIQDLPPDEYDDDSGEIVFDVYSNSSFYYDYSNESYYDEYYPTFDKPETSTKSATIGLRNAIEIKGIFASLKI